jgi:hypothetical protein
MFVWKSSRHTRHEMKPTFRSRSLKLRRLGYNREGRVEEMWIPLSLSRCSKTEGWKKRLTFSLRTRVRDYRRDSWIESRAVPHPSSQSGPFASICVCPSPSAKTVQWNPDNCNPDNCKTRIIAMHLNVPLFSLCTQSKKNPDNCNPDNCKTRIIAILFSVPMSLLQLFWTRIIAIALWNREVTGKRQSQSAITCPALTIGFIFFTLDTDFPYQFANLSGIFIFHARFGTYKPRLTRIIPIYFLFSLNIRLNA